MKKNFRIIKFKKDKPIFQIKNLSKSYDGKPILKKISLELYPGECVGLLGPNGSGKSTLYSTIIGETYADEGKIIINGNCFFYIFKKFFKVYNLTIRFVIAIETICTTDCLK